MRSGSGCFEVCLWSRMGKMWLFVGGERSLGLLIAWLVWVSESFLVDEGLLREILDG